ncbi:MAG: phosphate ABC transporter permease PstA [Verrucomicrobiales bacterium]|nr:phosphate ABC transporter permease PstA [Verrucomicrobiales bacterium]
MAAGRRPDSQHGEPKVWLSALGLTVGLLMVVGLLGLILIKGLQVFWPAPVVQMQVKKADGSVETLAGEIRVIQHRRDAAKEGQQIEEILLFMGNKDVFGNAFRYIDTALIESRELPKNIVVAERMEYGDGIFFPVALKRADGAEVTAADAAFYPALQEEVDRVAALRRDIEHIEKKEIGRINKELLQINLKRKALGADALGAEALGAEGDAAALAGLDEEQTRIQAEYEKLAAQARQLRDQLGVSTLTYRLADGQQRDMSVGNLVTFERPNNLGFGGKLLAMVKHGWAFLSGTPREANTEGGIFPAIFGTFVMTVLMSILVTPFGVIAAIYLREYAKQGFLVQAVRISINNLAGVPSIVFGVFGLGFFVYTVGGTIDRFFFSEYLPNPTFGTGGILWASFTLALMTLPVVIVATEEALVAVPRGVREAALACGASKWQTIQRIVLPGALPGILTGVILSMARGAGEVAPLMIVGVVKLAPSLPFDFEAPFIHAERKFMHLGFHIYDLGFQSPDSEAAKPMVFATTLLLIALVVIMNVAAIQIRNHLRRKYAASTF